LFIAYALACTYLWARQSHFIFTPRKEIKKTPEAHQLPFEDVYISISDPDGRSERIHGWWIPAVPPSDRVLLYLHGGALNIGANVDAARRFHDLGFSVFLVSYRGYGLSDGEFPSEDKVYADAQAAWNYLTEQQGIKPNSIFIYGHSIGGAIAIDLAVRQPDTAGLIAEATFTSIVDVARLSNTYRLFPLSLIVHQQFNSLEKIVDLRVPVLFIHGTDDHLIPTEMSHMLYAHAPSQKYLKIIAGGGHNNNGFVGGDDYLTAIANFVSAAGQFHPKHFPSTSSLKN
jgi:pimeloyl-ACP methyl ester carboxylesterase